MSLTVADRALLKLIEHALPAESPAREADVNAFLGYASRILDSRLASYSSSRDGQYDGVVNSISAHLQRSGDPESAVRFAELHQQLQQSGLASRNELLMLLHSLSRDKTTPPKVSSRRGRAWQHWTSFSCDLHVSKQQAEQCA